ncbi:MAG: glycoside hydrolase family 113 [Planctomycetia bacterium]
MPVRSPRDAVFLVWFVVSLVAFSYPGAVRGQPGLYEPHRDPAVGFNLISWHNFGASGTSVWADAVQSLYDAGFRQVSVSPVRFVNTATGAITASPTQSPTLGQIEAGVVRAKQLGMKVIVNPFVEPEGFHSWRGTFDPAPGGGVSNQFWSDYRSYMNEVATWAQGLGADEMTVGTEYNGLANNPGNASQWSATIGSIDARFAGRLGYAANWDSYRNQAAEAAIWSNPAIDFLGIDAYFTDVVSGYQQAIGATEAQRDAALDNNMGFTTQVPGQTMATMMMDAWNLKLDGEILPYAAALREGAGLPVKFNEVGFLPRNRTAADPQATNGANASVDSVEQRLSFEGLLRALDGRRDVLESIDVWQWGMPGADGSLWNMGLDDPALAYQDSLNRDTAQFLSAYVSNPVPEPGAVALLLTGGVAAAGAFSWGRRRGNASPSAAGMPSQPVPGVLA